MKVYESLGEDGIKSVTVLHPAFTKASHDNDSYEAPKLLAFFVL